MKVTVDASGGILVLMLVTKKSRTWTLNKYYAVIIALNTIWLNIW